MTDSLKATREAQADAALAVFGMRDAALDWLSFTHNAVFDVRHDGARFVLRVGSGNTAAQVQSEVTVLKTIGNAGLHAPYPVQTHITDDFAVVLFRHLAGETRTPSTLTLDDVTAIGRYLAQLHQLNLPIANRPQLDWDGLFGKTGIYQPSSNAMRAFSDEHLAVMADVTARVREAMQSLGTDAAHYGLIHGDLLLKNILFHGGDVHALDWEFCGGGYYIYDLTPLLWMLKPQPNYAIMQSALLDGYRTVPDAHAIDETLLETFIAGRQVASMRWVAANQDNPYVVGKVAAILDQRTDELRYFLTTNHLKRS